ncbi:PLP-dependent aminotransferase family protein [Delftia sp. WSY_9]|jgi:DNA-binding transcriptional MocR family regulator|uniref:aminotransferase-like domain-containing protein n=1 Tax=Delftia TaxID=80865 RepID=UPI001AE2AF53|nr:MULTISPECIES: PLP-dependent aminotransferase family protein [Delftia]MDH0773159.1 PLP-dependent aminotransferase family protein [Delftia tsuruhatensis]MDH0850047.1 PLP-dependent aminotransferase family protein [Delftia tsuruhatensis]MDH1457615.1 PLP-dependent aminotransferase family protein [Delftia tsuruhatensis]MDH1823940.1 PLP-dependent aminotransferase family protein [Delftia tsuruhatensis]WGG13380.1 PLP-dependent aminotransferase family protein [Delftia tsuruhatensis]
MQDDSLPSWLPRLAVQRGPRFLQIADALQAAVADGSLKPGDRLPPQRLLAAQLDVDLTTITRAYDEARRRHLLEGRGARGTYVAAPKVEWSSVLDLSMNTPPPPEGVDFDDMLKQGLSQVLMRADAQLLMTYHLGGGSDSDRKAAAQWLEPMFGSLDDRQIVVCPGAQAAIAALILALTAPGDVILAEPASYPGLRAAAAQFGRRILAVQADRQGMVPEMLEQACREHRPALVYLNPTLQNPTAITMSEGRRKQLASVARRCQVRIVEDDPYWLLADAPPPPIAAFAPQQVYYISTLSKCLTPGLRVAFVLMRDPHERQRFLVALRSFALMATPVTAALATQWILDGSAGQLMDGVRKEARLRHRMARDILAGRYSGAGDGLHVWLELPGYWTCAQLARAADSEGIAVTPAQAFATGSESVNAIRISLGSIKDRGRLHAGLQRLSHLLARLPESFSAAVV